MATCPSRSASSTTRSSIVRRKGARTTAGPCASPTPGTRSAPEILLDHIVFTHPRVTGPKALTATGLRVMPGAGRVEQVIHSAVDAVFDREEDFTYDHRSVTVDVVPATDPVG